ncbi:hypothetical protein TNCV_1367341 [Trichonephila clavipes]|nr:hypothetical protein TNCV_1367341 [Trichonephila clavipes]
MGCGLVINQYTPSTFRGMWYLFVVRHHISRYQPSQGHGTESLRSTALPDEEALGIFERKILHCILGGIQVKGSWRRSNLDLCKIYKQPDIVKFVKLQRLKWDGHLARMNDDRSLL